MWSTLCPSQGSAIPCSRSKLAVCLHEGHVYMLGGRNGNVPVRDFWKYSISEHVWSEISSKGDSPNCLQDHTIIGWRGKLYVFGGEVGFASTGETPLWCYNIAASSWKKLSRGDATRPQGCRGHTAALYDNCMYIYGGYRDLKGSISDLWCFDIEKETWKLCKSVGNGCEVPSGRHDHSVVVYDGAMWVYGGMTDLQAKGDFWRWDFGGCQWSRVRCKGGPGDLHGHSACKILTSMVVFGGERGGQLLQEIWRYYFSLEVWEKLNVSGTKPSPRSRHLTVVIPTLLLLLPHSFESNPCNETPQYKQRRFQDLVSSGSYAPSFSPNDPCWEQPKTISNSRLPKSETSYNCCQTTQFSNKGLGGTNDGMPKKMLISTSFSQNNFKFFRERISTTNLFKPQAFNAATYVALSNSSDSVQSGQEEVVTAAGAVGDNSRATLRPLLLDSTNNKRFYGKNGMLSVPNFLKIHQLERRGLMDDLSDSSSVDISAGINTTPKKLCGENDAAVRNTLRMWDPDSLENIPDIKDFISPDVGDRKFQEDAASIKLIDFEENCGGPVGGASCSLPATPMNSQPLPKSLSFIERPLAVVNESLQDKHRVYANCLSRTSPVTPDGNYRWSTNVEMKTFQQRLPDFDEGISEDMFPSPDERDEEDEEEEVEMMNKQSKDQTMRGGNEDELKPQVNNQSRHFSMLVLGGREQGFNGCGRRPIIVWKLDFWK